METQYTLQKALAVTQRMYDCAQNADWDAITELEKEQKQLIAEFFNHYLGGLTAELERQVRTIQEINQNVLRMALSAKNGMQLDMMQLKRAGNAARAYVANSR